MVSVDDCTLRAGGVRKGVEVLARWSRRLFGCKALRSNRVDSLGTTDQGYGAETGSIHIMSGDVLFWDAESGAEVQMRGADVPAARNSLVGRAHRPLMDTSIATPR